MKKRINDFNALKMTGMGVGAGQWVQCPIGHCSGTMGNVEAAVLPT
jgi:hypothetical protein